MAPDRVAVGMGRADDEQAADDRGLPAPLRREEPGGEAHLAVVRGEQVLEVGDPGLDLDDDQGAVRLVPAHDVDAAPLAGVAERVLDQDLPARRPQTAHDLLDEPRVRRVEEPVELRTAPARRERQRRVERSPDVPQRPERDASESSTLDLGDALPGDAGDPPDIRLAETAVPPKRADQQTNGGILHSPSVGVGAHRALTKGSPPLTRRSERLVSRAGRPTERRLNRYRWQTAARTTVVPLPLPALSPAPPDPILGLAETFRADSRPGKVNLAVGVYVDETGRTPVLPSVVDAERCLLERGGSKTYRPIEGAAGYRHLVRDLVFARRPELAEAGRLAVAQTPGGTGGLRVAADFLRQTGAVPVVWLPEPTWPNHPQLFRLAGFAVRSYPYVEPAGRHIDEAGLLATLRSAGPGEVVLLHGSCHNPTGIDPSPGLWSAIADTVVERELLPLVDFAYQGFGDGLLEDADWLEAFARPGLESLVASSFSKNFALYDERVGALTVIAADGQRAAAALSHVKVAIRANYSNPPAHGADIVETILGERELLERWQVELAGMRGRIQANRGAFVDALVARGVPGDWEPLRRQRGMFALLGLAAPQIARLRDEYAVYVVTGGRVNVAGLTPANLPLVVDALAAVLGR